MLTLYYIKNDLHPPRLLSMNLFIILFKIIYYNAKGRHTCEEI